jgi:predicted nucleic acid-binding protein
MIVADSNIIVPLFIAHAESERCRALLHRDPDWHLPDWWQIECANVLRSYHRSGQLTVSQALRAMRSLVEFLPPSATHPVDPLLALQLACKLAISAYDARFIALAKHFRTKLVTEDRRLRLACPGETLSLAEALS